MKTPKPGRPVRGSRTGRPIMALFDLLGRRWTIRILWELRRGPRSFTELQAGCDAMSPSVLNQRLAELQETGLVRLHDEGGYAVTAEGHSLLASLAPLDDWSKRWAQRVGASQNPGGTSRLPRGSRSAARSRR